jgi:hypothetical protein
VRTLDCLHLATIEFIRGQGETVELASYDNRLLAAARGPRRDCVLIIYTTRQLIL